MKKKLWIALSVAAFVVASMTFMIGCGDNTPEHTHTWATEWTSDGTSHWHACTGEGCDEKNDLTKCAGGTATCSAKSVCDTCHNAYGELDPDNHASTTFTYESNGDGTHTKKHECCGAVEAADEACSGGTATCVEKAECELCGGKYGEVSTTNHDWATAWTSDGTNHWHACTREDCTAKNDEAACSGGTATCLKKATCDVCKNEYGTVNPDNHTWGAGYDTADAEYDYRKCECGEVDTDKAHAFKKTIDKLNQELDMTADTVAIDLTGASEYASVKSITLVGEEALDLGTNVGAIGFGTVKADPTKHGAKTVKIVVTGADGADHEISVPVILVTKKIASNDDLKALLLEGQSETDLYGYYTIENDIVYTGTQPKTVFHATLDGKDHTVTTANLNNGLFNQVSAGANIKNLIIAATISQNSGNYYKAVVASYIYAKTTFENITIKYVGGIDSADIYGGGFISRSACTGATFKNLKVLAGGKKIGSLFGQSTSGVKFENCTVVADEVNCMASKADGSGRVEIDGITGIDFILGSQEVLLTAETQFIDLKGLDNGRTVRDIKVGDVSLGNTPSALVIPDDFKNNLQVHGKTTVTVEFTDGTTIDIGVIFVTSEITTDDQLKILFRNGLGDPRPNLYGYYVLGNDIVYTGNRNYIEFYGTFDGKGKTVTTSNVANGLFTYLKGGATVKNLTIKATTSMPSYACVIASGIYSSTVENVTVEYIGGNDTATIEAFRGFVTREGIQSSTIKKLVVKASGKKIGSLFGSDLTKVTFVDCSVTADELGCVICDKTGAASVMPDDVTGIEFNIGAQA